ncbi:hypothetical protein HDU67_006673 [Dinochytrium kinnereticum]|nr:hypothetical protein HDU67_006673 [Dinochytrium kinnereticum]
MGCVDPIGILSRLSVDSQTGNGGSLSKFLVLCDWIILGEQEGVNNSLIFSWENVPDDYTIPSLMRIVENVPVSPALHVNHTNGVLKDLPHAAPAASPPQALSSIAPTLTSSVASSIAIASGTPGLQNHSSANFRRMPQKLRLQNKRLCELKKEGKRAHSKWAPTLRPGATKGSLRPKSARTIRDKINWNFFKMNPNIIADIHMKKALAFMSSFNQTSVTESSDSKNKRLETDNGIKDRESLKPSGASEGKICKERIRRGHAEVKKKSGLRNSIDNWDSEEDGKPVKRLGSKNHGQKSVLIAMNSMIMDRTNHFNGSQSESLLGPIVGISNNGDFVDSSSNFSNDLSSATAISQNDSQAADSLDASSYVSSESSISQIGYSLAVPSDFSSPMLPAISISQNGNPLAGPSTSSNYLPTASNFYQSGDFAVGNFASLLSSGSIYQDRNHTEGALNSLQYSTSLPSSPQNLDYSNGPADFSMPSFPLSRSSQSFNNLASFTNEAGSQYSLLGTSNDWTSFATLINSSASLPSLLGDFPNWNGFARPSSSFDLGIDITNNVMMENDQNVDFIDFSSYSS